MNVRIQVRILADRLENGFMEELREGRSLETILPTLGSSAIENT